MTVRRLVVRVYGGPEQLTLGTVREAPEIGPGQLLVDVEASGINYLDVYQRSGEGVHNVPLPFTPGFEGVGRVRQVGEGAAGFAVGQRVAWINVRGSYASQVAMRATGMLTVLTTMLTVFASSGCRSSPAEHAQGRVVRIAELEIDPAELESYKAHLREEIETSVREEPGVLTLYAVSVKENPSQIRILEVYANADAYKSHLQTPHFRKYKTGTQRMVRSLRLVETDPILLGDKAR